MKEKIRELVLQGDVKFPRFVLLTYKNMAKLQR